MMHYTQRQLRETVGITAETYRHWRKELLPLSNVKGHGAFFTPGDLVAVAIIRVLCADLDMRVRVLSPLADSLFETCRTTPWPTLERGYFNLDVAGKTISFSTDNKPTSTDDVTITVPLWPIITQLQAHFIDIGVSDPQQTLRFPPLTIQDANKRAEERTRSVAESEP